MWNGKEVSGMRRNWVKVLVLLLVGLMLCGCEESRMDTSSAEGEDRTTEAITESVVSVTPETVENEATESSPVSTSETISTTEVELEEIDIFADIIVTFDGWNNFGWADEIITENCDGFIKDNVAFSFATEHKDLWNGREVTVVAEYDSDVFLENGLTVSSDTMQYTVAGLREIIAAQNFYDGVAWVKVREQGVEQWCCCDNRGNVLYYLGEGLEPTTCFANGVAIVDNCMVVNKNGEAVWSAGVEGKEYAHEVWGEDAVQYITIRFSQDQELEYPEEFLGYAFVEIGLESYDFSGRVTGVLNPDGSWRYEPSTGLNHGTYDGAGMYDVRSSEMWYYDVIGNVTCAGSPLEQTTQDWRQENRIKYIKTNNIHEGLVFQWEDYPDTSGFFNMEGEKIIDLSKYNIVHYLTEPEFNEGYALLEIENDQGSRYYTIIDLLGNEMFPPQKAVEHGTLRCGYYWADGVGYMNVHGEPAFTEFVAGRAFQENMALVRTPFGELHFIDTTGTIIF